MVEPTLYGNDGRQAIKYVRQHATELGVNPDKIGIMGFSAGALVTSNVVFIHDEKSRPNLAAFIYGRGAANTIPDPMPLFMCSPVNDGNPPEGLFTTYKNWKAAGAPSELQFIYDARHGEGLQYNGKEWNEWIDNLYNFMKAVQFIDK
jgi:dienelactone hydrolase